MATLEELAELYKALSHPKRLAILGTLQGKELCVCEIEETLHLRQAYVSQQLTVLREASLVCFRKDGLHIWYSVSRPEVYALLHLADTIHDQLGACADTPEDLGSGVSAHTKVASRGGRGTEMTNESETIGYRVTVEQKSEQRARAEARGHNLMLNIKKGDGSAGFNAAETLLAALGACILTNVTAIAEKMHLKIDGARVDFDATRHDEPPALDHIAYHLVIDSSESEEKLQRLHELAIGWGTVTNTLIDGLAPEGVLVRQAQAALGDMKEDADV
ncbi:MAG: metalloregulator ArsR/SmtB family transcription factor [Anaerolineae bacterium]|nr:metalloregulator ArsR/SmtB family transcription factor [Anaerolineae bacterium]